jgi:hypothetical protein
MQLSEACRLYNAALQERRDAYRTHRKSLNYYDQANQLKEIRDGRGIEPVVSLSGQTVTLALSEGVRSARRDNFAHLWGAQRRRRPCRAEPALRV